MELRFKVAVCKSIEKDSWANGCDPDSGQYLGCIETQSFGTMDAAFSFIHSFGNEPFIFDDRVEIQVMEDDDGNKASSVLMEGFKEGRFDLWLANYSFYVTKIERTELVHADLVRAFPNLSAEAS